MLGGVFWAATTGSVRLSRLAEAPSTQTLFYQLLIGGILLLPLAVLTGQAAIQWTVLSISSLVFHTVVISFASYLIWFWMLKHYLASRLGVFSFLTPVFGMLCGVLILDEHIEINFIIGTCMVMLGVILVSLQGWLKNRISIKAFKSKHENLVCKFSDLDWSVFYSDLGQSGRRSETDY